MLELEEIKKRLQDRNLSAVARNISNPLQETADAMKVTKSYLQSIRCGRFKPGKEMHKRISDYLTEGREKDLISALCHLEKLIERNQSQLPPEMARVMEEEFWNLI